MGIVFAVGLVFIVGVVFVMETVCCLGAEVRHIHGRNEASVTTALLLGLHAAWIVRRHLRADRWRAAAMLEALLSATMAWLDDQDFMV